MRINVDVFNSEIDEYKEPVKNLLIELKKCYLGNSQNNKSEQYELAMKIIKELFNPNNLYSEPLIPLSFLNTMTGTILMSILKEEKNRLISIKDIINMSKSPSKPNGYSYQYISKEIKEGRLKAERYQGRWLINISDANNFLKGKKKK